MNAAQQHRPMALATMVGQSDQLLQLQIFLRQHSIRHMMFVGPPGCGKTTAALAFLYEWFARDETLFEHHVLRLNASSSREISVVRTTIKEFMTRKCPPGYVNVIVLDEAEALTKDAQMALKALMDDPMGCFILLCNQPWRIDSAIHSRCDKFMFAALTDEDVFSRLLAIEPDVQTMGEEAKKKLLNHADGDLRKAINKTELAQIVKTSTIDDGIHLIIQAIPETFYDELFSPSSPPSSVWSIVDQVRQFQYDTDDILKDITIRLADQYPTLFLASSFLSAKEDLKRGVNSAIVLFQLFSLIQESIHHKKDENIKNDGKKDENIKDDGKGKKEKDENISSMPSPLSGSYGSMDDYDES